LNTEIRYALNCLLNSTVDERMQGRRDLSKYCEAVVSVYLEYGKYQENLAKIARDGGSFAWPEVPLLLAD
jgi:hypothetical protein